MSEASVASEDETKQDCDVTGEKKDISPRCQNDSNESKVQPSVEEVHEINDDNLKSEEHVLQLIDNNLTLKNEEEVKEIKEVQQNTSENHLESSSQSPIPRPSKDPETVLDENKETPDSSPAVPRKDTGNVTDTYDVITRKEIQGLTEWESIHRESLSEIPPIDPGALHDLESRAKDVAHNLDHLLGTLAASLKSLSVIGVQSVDAYRKSVENVEETVDVSIKSMYTLIAKCEELNSHMGPLYNIAAQIKEIKSTLDVFESLCK